MIWMILRSYLRLGRIHSSVLAGLTPVIVAAVSGSFVSLFHFCVLFVIGLLFHVFLFVYNEICDLVVDSTSQCLMDKPLVVGSVTIGGAKKVVISALILIFLLTTVFFYENIVYLIVLIFLAVFCGVLYDKFGKSVAHADYFLAASIFFLALYGNFTVSRTLSIFVLIISALGFFQTLIQNVIAGLKDVDHDFYAGGKSTSLRFGVKVRDKKLLISKGFITYVSFLKFIHIFIIVIPFVVNIISYKIWHFFFVLFFVVLSIIFLMKLLTFRFFEREKIMRTIGFHEIFVFMVIPFMIADFIGFYGLFFLVLFPIIWLAVFLRLLYGRLMPNI